MTPGQTASLQTLQRYYDLFNAGNRDEFLALLAPDVVHDINQGSAEHGVPAFREFLERMDRSYAEQVEDLQLFASEDGSRGAAEFFIRGKYLQTDSGLPPAAGQTYYLRVGAFFEIRDGKIARVTNYYNLQDWLRQVGA